MDLFSEQHRTKFATNFTHSELVKIAYRWLVKTKRCGVAFRELKTYCSNGECPDAIGFNGWSYSCLVEVKVSRADFLSDAKKKFRREPKNGMGTERFYMCPAGLIEIKDLPHGWGLIYVSLDGKARLVHTHGEIVTVGRTSRFVAFNFEKNVKAEHELMYSALRRLYIKGHIESIYDKKYVNDYKEF